jgi:hypothetical protein
LTHRDAKGWHDTAAKAALFIDGAKVGELAGNFNREANELARVAVPRPLQCNWTGLRTMRTPAVSS